MSRKKSIRKPSALNRITPDESPKKAAQVQKTTSAEQDVNIVRRNILAAIGGTALLAGAVGLSGIFSQKDQPDAAETEASSGKKVSKVKLSEDKSIDIPTFKVETTTTIKYEKPATLQMDDAELVALSNRFAEQIKQIAANFNATIGDDQRLYLSNLNGVLQQLQNVVMYGDPRITADFKEFSKTTSALSKEDRFPLIIERINQYLLPAGMYIFFQLRTRNNIPRLNVYSVTESGEVTIADKVRHDKVPFLKLDSPLLPAHRLQLGGTVDPTKKRVVIFQDELALIAKDFLAAAGVPDSEENKREFRQNSLRHEATHLFITDRFPRMSSDLKKTFPHDVDYEMDGEKKKLTMDIHVYSAHEVCGLGAQLMNANTKMEILAYLNMKGSTQYALAQALISLAVLQIADSPMGKCDLTDLVNGNCPSALDKAREIVKTPAFSVENCQQVGQILYKFGYSFFKANSKSTK